MRAILATAALALLLVPASTAATATSSTGNIDTYNLTGDVPCTLSTHPSCDLVQMCPDVIISRTITLTLIDPSPGDVVALTLVGDEPGNLGTLSHPGVGAMYPTDIATYDDPVAKVSVLLQGCDTWAAVVTGILVNGEVTYTIG